MYGENERMIINHFPVPRVNYASDNSKIEQENLSWAEKDAVT